jgi:hypothetical protein
MVASPPSAKVRVVVAFVALSALPLAVACGGSAQQTKPVAAPAAAPPPPPPAAKIDHTLRRSAVHAALRAGLGAFLSKVELDDQPVRQDGKFHGFRVTALHDPSFWNGIDLRPGDVVTKVNGLPIERPEQALEAFHSLESASEVRVTVERDGAPHDIVYPIVDDEKRADASAP